MEDLDILRKKFWFGSVEPVLDSYACLNTNEERNELFEVKTEKRRFYVLRDGTEVLNDSGKHEEYVFDSFIDEGVVCREYIAEEDIKNVKTNNVIPYQNNHFLATKLKKDDIIKEFTDSNAYHLTKEESEEFLSFLDDPYMAWYNAYRSFGKSITECIQNIRSIGFGDMAAINYLKIELHQEYETQYNFDELTKTVIKEVKSEDWPPHIKVVVKDSKYIKPKEFTVFALTFMPE